MNQDNTLMVTCLNCDEQTHIPVDELLDHTCFNCGSPTSTVIESNEQEILISEIDKATKEMDQVTGGITHGFMSPDEAAEWLEHDSLQIIDVLEKAKDFIEDSREK